MRKWNFSFLLLIAYLGSFHIWMFLSYPLVIFSGLCVSMLLCVTGYFFYKSGYFANIFDVFWHLTVIIDLVLECTLPIQHDHFNFYYCALAFALVVGGYRVYALRKLADPDLAR